MNKLNRTNTIKEFFGRHETISVLLIVAFIVAALASMFLSPQLYQRSIHEGDVALKDIYAPYDLVYQWEIDEKKTSEARQAAVSEVPYSLLRDFASEKESRSKIEKFFKLLEEQNELEVSLSDKVAGVKSLLEEDISDKNIRVLLDHEDPEAAKEAIFNISEKTFVIGIISEGDLKWLNEAGVEKVAIVDKALNGENYRKPNELLRGRRVKEMAQDYAGRQFEGDRKTAAAVTSIVVEYLSPNLKLDEKKTEAEKEVVRKKVPPVYRNWTIKKNELMVEKGKRVNARHIAQLSQLRRFLQPGKSPKFLFGVLLLFALLSGIAFINMMFSRGSDFLIDTKNIAITLLNMFFIILIADFIMRSPQPSYFIPMASMAMMICLLVGFSVAFMSTLVMSILIALLIGGNIELALVMIVGSVVGMFLIKDVRRRTDILLAGLFVGVAKFLGIVCVGLINDMAVNVFIKDGMWGIASGVLSGFIVMGLLPVFEHFFHVPTNISLLELSDLNHPLLKELAIKAPGTYHHSMMVGNLAEAACDSVGANSLLARVGSYYHDIGKVSKAEYFSENEMGAGSKHSKLTPQMSALIIAKHVKEGVETAKKHNLNSTIVDFISQHHGDSLIAFFYQKALEKAAEGEIVEEANFRYPGPRPATKERAIVLLADAVEASSRSLDEPTPASIRNLVKKIINNKFIDGQLEGCDLTLKDIQKIVDSFVRVLMGIFHTRLSYPEEGKKTVEEISNGDKNKLRKQKPKTKS